MKDGLQKANQVLRWSCRRRMLKVWWLALRRMIVRESPSERLSAVLLLGKDMVASLQSRCIFNWVRWPLASIRLYVLGSQSDAVDCGGETTCCESLIAWCDIKIVWRKDFLLVIVCWFPLSSWYVTGCSMGYWLSVAVERLHSWFSENWSLVDI